MNYNNFSKQRRKKLRHKYQQTVGRKKSGKRLENQQWEVSATMETSSSVHVFLWAPHQLDNQHSLYRKRKSNHWPGNGKDNGTNKSMWKSPYRCHQSVNVDNAATKHDFGLLQQTSKASGLVFFFFFFKQESKMTGDQKPKQIMAGTFVEGLINKNMFVFW